MASIIDNSVTLSASLVLYKNDQEMVRKAVISVLESPVNVKLYVIDNSPTAELAIIFTDLDIEYHHTQGINLGFGKAHNIALSKIPNSDYHLILNPDIYFDQDVLPILLQYLQENQEIGLISPKIYYPKGELQYLCKRYPSVFLLFARRFLPKKLQEFYKKHLDWYEMRDTGYNKIIDVPYLSGCFMLFRRKYLDEIGYFDEKIFMYLEDADITLRMAKKYKTIFYPHVHIFHHWAKGSYKSLKLTMVNIQSAIYFFNKHGWKLF